MKPEAQRIAIAEACGWELKSTGLSPMRSWQNESLTHRIKWVAHKEMAYQGVLPDYLNDLNAMHEAEKLLTKKQRPFYAGELIDATVAECMEQHAEVFVVAHATAAQRAEAFLKTLNLWTDKA